MIGDARGNIGIGNGAGVDDPAEAVAAIAPSQATIRQVAATLDARKRKGAAGPVGATGSFPIAAGSTS